MNSSWNWDVLNDLFRLDTQVIIADSDQWIQPYKRQITGGISSFYSDIHPDDHERIISSIGHVILNETSVWEEEFRFKMNSETYSEIYVRAQIIRENGRAVRMNGMIMDISHLNRFRKNKHLPQISNVESYLHTVLIHAHVGIVMTGNDGKFRFANKAFQDMTGYTENELYQKTFEDITHPEDIQKSRELVSNLKGRKGTGPGIVKKYIRKDNNIVWVNISPTYVTPDENDEPTFVSIVTDITQQVKSKVLQEKLNVLVDNSAELMAILEFNGSNSYINKAGREMLGFGSDRDVQNTSISELHTPEDLAFVKETVLPTIMDTGKWSGEMLVRNLQSGEVFPVENYSIRIDDPFSGEPMAIGAVMRDLRQEKINRKALIESEQRFRNMIMKAPVAIGIMKGPEFYVEVANAPLLELWGKDETIIGLPLLQALPEIKNQQFMSLLRTVVETGEENYGFEVLAQLKRNGNLEECYFNFVYSPVREADNQISGVMAVATEVTAQVMAKKKIEESEKKFRSLILEAPVATSVFVGRDMHIQLANETMLSIWGKDNSVIGKPLAEAVPELVGQPFLPILDEVYTTGKAYQSSGDKAILEVNGERKTSYFNFTYQPLFDENGNVYAILDMAIDVTAEKMNKQQLELMVEQRTEELRHLNSNLQHTNHELEQFAYVASHDLQEPLRKIQMFSDLLLKQYSGDEMAGRYLDKIIYSASRMGNLIKDLLDFSRIPVIHDLFTTIDLNQVMITVLDDLELKIEEKKAVIHFSDLPQIKGIPLQIHQLFMNLIGNSLKFAHSERIPEIHIRSRMATIEEIMREKLKREKQYHLISIADNGIGFEPYLIEKLFQIFQRLSTKNKTEGTGIGLALCRKIVLTHGGYIWAEGEEGNGAVFSFMLPVID